MQHLKVHIPDLVRSNSLSVKCRQDRSVFEYRIATEPHFFRFLSGEYGYRVDDSGHLATTDQRHFPDATIHGWSTSDFAQSWLFFEVLQEVFWEVQGFDVAAFVYEDGRAELIVDTKPLIKLIPALFDKLLMIKESSELDFLSRVVRIQDVLSTARSYASRSVATQEWRVEANVAFSILVLGETLSAALYKIQTRWEFEFRGWFSGRSNGFGWGYSQAVLDALTQVGWRADSVDLLCKQFKNSTVALLLALELRTPPGESWQDENNYKQYHNHEKSGRRCHPIQLRISSQLIDIIRANQIPLFTYDCETRELGIRGVVESELAMTDYIVFSHVWADGFGNPNGNKMPSCVLEHLVCLGERVNGEPVRVWTPIDTSWVPRRGSCWFWIDTLAIPNLSSLEDSSQEIRVKAIDKIHQIYSCAKATYALDKGLLEMPRGDSFTAKAMRISLSIWTQRLWTLQEAFLSRKLYFVFKDGLCAWNDLQEYREMERDKLWSPAPEIAMIYKDLILAPRAHSDDATRRGELRVDHPPEIVGSVWKAAQWRVTKHPHHEPLSLATLFNLDVTAFAGANNKRSEKRDLDEIERHMKHLITLLVEKRYQIPVEFMFLPGPYLAAKGLRWAPRSWLYSKERNAHPDMYPMAGGRAGHVEDVGLKVRLPGFWLHGLKDTVDRLIRKTNFHFPTSMALSEWYNVRFDTPEQSWYPLIVRKNIGMALIHLVDFKQDRENLADLVTIVKQNRGNDNELVVEILCRVWLSKETNVAIVNRCKAGFRRDLTPPLCIGERLPTDQQWTVDGFEAPRPGQPERPRTSTSPELRQQQRRTELGGYDQISTFMNLGEQPVQITDPASTVSRQDHLQALPPVALPIIPGASMGVAKNVGREATAALSTRTQSKKSASRWKRFFPSWKWRRSKQNYKKNTNPPNVLQRVIGEEDMFKARPVH